MKTQRQRSAELDKRSRQHLTNALLDGRYELERQTVFFQRRDVADSLLSPEVNVLGGTVCQPVKQTKSGSLLVTADVDGSPFFAWIHP